MAQSIARPADELPAFRKAGDFRFMLVLESTQLIGLQLREIKNLNLHCSDNMQGVSL